MPDPTIAMGVQVPQPSGMFQGGPGGGASTIEMFARTQNMLNQNRLFQQTFGARQKAGNIIASMPPGASMTDIFQALQRDPDVAPFAGQISNEFRQSALTGLQMEKTQQELGQGALQHYSRSMGAVATDPSQWLANHESQIATMSPTARAFLAGPGGPLDSIRESMIGGLDKLPGGLNGAAAGQEFTKRAMARAVAVGEMPQDQFRSIVGQPEMVQQGNKLTPTLVSPYGVVSPTGPGFGMGAPPGYREAPGGYTIPVPGLTPSGVPTGPTNLLGGREASPGAPGPTSASAGMVAGDGRPLTSGPMTVPGSTGTAMGGFPLMTKPQLDQAARLNEEFGTAGLRAFNNAQAAMSSAQYMNSAFDNLVRGGGFLQPGAGAQFRLELAKAVNNFTQITGNPPPFDPTKIASMEDFNKETKRMGLQVLTTMLGNQREAAQTISSITTSVPGIENTYLGGKLVLNGIVAATQRIIDQRNFENDWQNKNHGSLISAAEEFASQHPAEGYARRVIDQFANPAMLQQEVNAGRMSKQQAIDFAKSVHGPTAPGEP